MRGLIQLEIAVWGRYFLDFNRKIAKTSFILCSKYLKKL